MHMSMIEIVLFVALHIYGSLLPQFAHKRLTGRYSLPFNWKLAALLNAAFCALYLWIMSISTWGYYILWILSVLGNVLSTIGWAVAIKTRPLEV